MAVRLVVNADVRGQNEVDRLNRSVRNIDRNTGALSRGLANVGRAVGAAFAVGAVVAFANRLTQAGDALVNVENQLRASGVANEDLASVSREVLDIANGTRSEYEATANLYARILRSSADLGVTQEESLEITRAFQQSLQLAGASTQEAAAASLQFGQALASGRLQGDELRSILENNPVFARALAEELGVGIGQLRELGAEGKLTSDLLADVALRIAPMMNERFEELEPTFASAFQVFSNGVQQAAGSFANLVLDATGINDLLISAGETLSSIFGPGGEGLDLSGLFDFSTIDFSDLGERYSDALVAGYNAVADNLSNFGEILNNIDFSEVGMNVVNSIIDFVSAINWEEVLVGIARVFVATGQLGAAIIAGLIDLVGGALDAAFSAFGLETDFSGIFSRVSDALRAVWEGAGDLLFGEFDEGITKIRGAFESLFSGLGEFFKAPVNELIRLFESGINTILLNIPDIVLPAALENGVSIPRLNQGGRISGPGSGTSDDILARLSNGEYVINAQATRDYLPLIEAINNGDLPRFQGGGAVGEGIRRRFGALGVDISNVRNDLSPRETRDLERLLVAFEGVQDREQEIINQQREIVEARIDAISMEPSGGGGGSSGPAPGDQLAQSFISNFESALVELTRGGSLENVIRGFVLDFAGNLAEHAAMQISGALFGNGSGLSAIFGGFFQDGGVVPGRGPVPVVAHGGEVILNRQQQEALLNGGMQRSNVTINISGNVDDRAIEQIRTVVQSSPRQVGNAQTVYNDNTRGLNARRR